MRRPVVIPDRLASNCIGHPDRMEWLRRLPVIVEKLEERWGIEVGEPFGQGEGCCAWVAPVRRADGTEAVLKLGMPHMEAEHEVEALSFWAGDPTVVLYEVDKCEWAMLLERCVPGTHLRTLAEPEQDVVIAGLLKRLWRVPPEPHPFRPLAEMTRHWAAETRSRPERWRDPGLVREGLELLETLPGNAERHVLLATDLHAGNVLRAQRQPWLVIDPKPFIGDPAYDATQHLLNCRERLRTDPLGLVRSFSDLLEVDDERVRLWTFARAAAETFDDWEADALAEIARALAPA